MSPSIRPLSPRRYARAVRRRVIRPPAVEPAPAPVEVEVEEDPFGHPPRRDGARSATPRRVPLTSEAIVESVASLGLDFWWVEDHRNGVLRFGTDVHGAPRLLELVLEAAEGLDLAIERRHPRTGVRQDSSVRAAQAAMTEESYVRFVAYDQRSSRPPFAMTVESWKATPEGHLASPNNNPVVSRIWRSTAEESHHQGPWNLQSLLPAPTTDSVQFDIDWVFSWVDASDPGWQELFAPWAPATTSDASDRSRFATRDDLKFALRSLDQFAPWIRTIHVLTNCRPPSWLAISHPKINWVDHEDVLEAENLPTFSSHAIETAVHRIPGLSEHFVYSNDDFFLTRPADKSDFFYANGIARLRLEKFGVVNGPVTPGDPDYLNGARTSAELLARDFEQFPVRLHTHSPQSMNRAVLEEMEERYRTDFERTRGNRFRHHTDVAVTGFLYHHYAFLTGRAVPDGDSTLLIQQNHRYGRAFAQLLRTQDSGVVSPHLSVCVNDGRGSHDNVEWNTRALEFLESYFPTPSSFEQAARSSRVDSTEVATTA